MPGKMARSAPRPSFGLPELLVAISTSRQSCYKAGKAQIFTPVGESSGESRLILSFPKTAPRQKSHTRGYDFREGQVSCEPVRARPFYDRLLMINDT